MKIKKNSMAMNYIQSCWDCGVTPNKRTLKKIQKQEEEWSITELDSDRRKYYEED